MKISLRFAPAVLALAFAAHPAFAVSKEMVQLQVQVQELQDAIARLQQSNDERMGVMKDLVTQTADSVNKMTVVVETLQKQMSAQQDAQNAKLDQASGQIQSLNDSLDELKARLARIEKSISDIQNQQQSINAALQNGAPPAGSSAPPSSNPPITAAPTESAPPTADNPAPLGDSSAAPVVRPKVAASDTGAPPPPVDYLYKTALGDYMGARYALAAAEFSDVVKFYSDDPLSGNAFYYLAEINYRDGKYSLASRNYDKLIAQFPASSKVPAAHLHKGQALIQMKQNDAGIKELRLVVQRFPNSPESAQARSKLSGMGVPITPRH